jgi:hypothetical protein
VATTHVPTATLFGFRIDPSEQRGASTIELAGGRDLAQQAATADLLDGRPACLLLWVRRSPHFFDSATDDSGGVTNVT